MKSKSSSLIRPFEVFCSEVSAIMTQAAESKGYNEGGPNAPNQLDDFMEKHFAGHALGEAAYKLVRYQAKNDPNDLIKAAAWIYLEWRRQLNATTPRSN